MSKTQIDTMLTTLYIKLLHTAGSVRDAEIALDPLQYYINTGRATTDFLKAVCAADVDAVANVLVDHLFDDYASVITALNKTI